MAEMVSLHTSDVITASPSTGYKIENEGYGVSMGDYSGFIGGNG